MIEYKKKLEVVGASEHNLNNIDVQIPHNSLTVITGVSGSGKSSLAYNVIFKESQRRFLESFSSFSRQYISKIEKPNVTSINGLQAALAINQKTVVANPRSTVGTMSGIYDYLRLLYARMGIAHCIKCGSVINKSDANICSACGCKHTEILAKSFSFNSKYGACTKCNGLGITEQIDKSKLIADENKTLAEGALVPTTPTGYIVYSQVRVDELNKVCEAHGFTVNVPWNKLTLEQQNVIWYGSNKVKILFGKHSLESRLKWKGITAKPREEAYYKGMIPIMEEILLRDRNDNILRFASSFECDECNGSRLNKEALAVTINNKNIFELCKLSLLELNKYLLKLSTSISNAEVYANILNHVFTRLEYLQLLGLNYLKLSSESTTISGGEAQRIRLASQVGSGLQGILYILDEPSVGLHHRDNKKLLKVLKSLRDNGNTLLVVEHDEDTIKAADYLIDIGPKAGIEGGNVIYQGTAAELLNNSTKYPNSLTASLMSHNKNSNINKSPKSNLGLISIKNASKFNLNNINVDFKLNAFNVVTGVSGAGKSTLVFRVLSKLLKGEELTDKTTQVVTTQQINRVIEINQSPIGKTPRSNPATYTDLWDHIRDLFAKVPESVKNGYKKGRFSFNNKGGRCEKCQGAGYISLGMHFLGDVEIVCDNCNGKRFNNDTLKIQYNGKNIFDILELSITQASKFFQNQPKILNILKHLINLDIGYLKLGQPSTTLSGGEAQRVKLASELYKKSKGHTLYILDEPTVGLHKADVNFLIVALGNIIDNKNTVIVVEHDLDMIIKADHIIDLGPEGGDAGGNLVCQGSVNDIMNCEKSYTGKAIIEHLNSNNSSSAQAIVPIKPSNIKFKGITTNNLKNIDVEIPINKTTVITGVSGSGKSSLAFDTIYAESRNRFTENFSTYARRMMRKIKKPEQEQCSGLTPAIAINQTKYSNNPRSTVGTITEVYDLYRLLYSRVGINKNGKTNDLPASMFSFNKIEAACETCSGLGVITTSDSSKFITHPQKSIVNGAMDGTIPGKFFGDVYGQYVATLLEVGKSKNIAFDVPYKDLSKKEKQIALFGTGEEKYNVKWEFKRGNRTGVHNLNIEWKGFVNLLNDEYEIKQKGARGEAYKIIMSQVLCKTCNGDRLNPEALDVTFNKLNISELSSKTISSSLTYFKNINSQITKSTFAKCETIVGQIISKLESFKNIGLGYISINRNTFTLSGGEAQRLRIATQLVTNLCGLTYILDEPTVGLHSHDTQNLINSLNNIKHNGNTIILVEHDSEVICLADNIIDIGVGAGENGGKIIAQGNVNAIKNNPNSITGQYLKKSSNRKLIDKRNLKSGIYIKGASANNLKNIDINIPIGGIVSITGVSGSGKTSLAFDVIAKSFNTGKAINCSSITFNKLDSILVVDQQKIGTSPLSTPATFTGVFDLIRELFAQMPESKSKKLTKSSFSFNSTKGRCSTCKGMGRVKVSMDFLSDVWTNCDSCNGKRYKNDILDIKIKELNIYDVLNMEVSEAILFFKDYTKITKTLLVLNDVGLGYIKLGQATNTLSGGETQRLKLANELINTTYGNCLYIFDEPSTGLHMKDVENLILVFNNLVNNNNTVLVVEHNLDIINASDWVIDLGPQGGDKGGEVIFAGNPNQIINCKYSFTGMALKKC